MCLSVCVCVCVYIYVCVCIYICVCVHECVCVCVSECVCVCISVRHTLFPLKRLENVPSVLEKVSVCGFNHLVSALI